MPRKPGRKSAAELAVVQQVTEIVPRPTAPDSLDADEARLWESIVSSREAQYFHAATLPLLANLCRSAVAAEKVSKWLKRALDAGSDADIEEVDRLFRIREREVRQASALSRALRLTPQSLISPHKAHGTSVSAHPKPWET